MDGVDVNQRIQFDHAKQIMEVDFSGLSFQNTEQVNAFYDVVDEKIAETGQSWYFLVNYQDCRIDPKAWVAFAHRGKRVNVAHSLGSVRYMAPAAERRVIENRSKQEEFDANLFQSREAALGRLLQMGAGTVKH